MQPDARELIKTKRNVVLQVNTQAKSTALKDWLKKQGTHAKLATASFDTAAADLRPRPKESWMSWKRRPRQTFRRL